MKTKSNEKSFPSNFFNNFGIFIFNFNYKTADEIREIFPESNEILPLDVLVTSGIAQEVQVPFPEAVTERNDHGMLSVNNDPIVWAMVNAIKELSSENDELRKRLDALEE